MAVEFPNEEKLAAIKDRLLQIKAHAEFRNLTTGGGKNSKGMYSKKIDFVSSRLSDLQ